MFEFKLPDLGEGIHEGELLKWHVQPGDSIKEDEPLVDVETDKAALTIPSPRAGKVVSTNGNVGDTLNVGDIVVVIDDGSAAATSEPELVGVAAATSAPAVVASAAAAPPQSRTPAPAASWGPVVAAPATRRVARELNVDIRQVPPTGPAGRVTREDVERFAKGNGNGNVASVATPDRVSVADDDGGEGAGFDPNAAGGAIPYLTLEPLPDFAQWGPVETEAVRSIRRKVARKMVTSMTIVPHVAHMDEADVTELDKLRRRMRDRHADQPGGKLTMLAFVVKAVTAGLKSWRSFNASLDFFKGQIVYKKYYNIGVAADTGRGLVVPVIRDTDRKSILQISADIEQAAGRARDGELDAAELRGGTFTITNVGAIGGTAVVPTINYPEVAILGMARVQEKPVVRNGEIVVRKMLPLTLTFDHRVADGAEAARFISELIRRLSDPDALLIET